ncbi:ABC transporter permease [Bradyrhizobium sp. AUGA SZCCT0274]|uniref:ABC transporter permease n=1 Tax=Bradyrhizobium sp. AUGA SZCCT0274 TaxID=2807670 RepID=UPI001BAD37F3|nr:ABC transporter permease [Bradyrhizobium sp. AUGA SZCCT0274]MBR1244196.1 ABC transporter permease [Bradyrhizobium sp. AUGA SZCCT0274]
MNVASFDRRDLVMLMSLFRMNLGDRFLGSSLGLVWAVLSPLMLMGIFCFVFTFVFPGRLPGKSDSHSYLIWLVSGYGPWLAVNEGLMSATSSVVSNTGVVKNIAFKSEILPIVGALMGLVPLGVGLVVILALQVVGGEAPKWTLVLLPFVLAIQLLFISGIGLFLSALNVFVRDTALILPNCLTMILFASPIFYNLSAYPAPIRAFLVYNPVYIIAELYRVIVVDGTLPPTWMVIYMTVLSVCAFAGGLWWFRRLKSFFDTRL